MSNYSFLSQILHKQFLNNENIINFQISRLKRNYSQINLKKCKFLFISGLARSGSTALLQALDQTDKFGSLRYKYMPFILSPKLANFYSEKLARNKNDEIERLHGDGLRISPNSPECLDEPYWINAIYKTLNNTEFLKPHKLKISDIKVYCKLLDTYLKIEKKKQFLIKNNNNHLRILSLASYLPNSNFLILFRNPIAHAKSLLNLHKKFIEIQNKDKFILDYMNLIGHWEFGNGKKSFVYAKGQFEILLNLDDLNIDYWLQQWIFTYKWIIETISKRNNFKNYNIKLVCYEDLCIRYSYKENLFKKLSIKKNAHDFNFHLGKSNFNNDSIIFNRGLIEEANTIYEKLRNKSYEDLNTD